MVDTLKEQLTGEIPPSEIARKVSELSGWPRRKVYRLLTDLQSEQENVKTGSNAPDADLPFNVSFQIQVTKLKVPTGFVLRSGYSATANIVVKKATNVLILPERLLHFNNNKTCSNHLIK